MKLKLKIQQKIQLFIISASIIIFVAAIGYISFNARKMAYNDAIEVTDHLVSEAAKDIKTNLNLELAGLSSLADAFKIYKDYSKDEWQEKVHKMYYNVFAENENVYALWSSWELNMIDPDWDRPTGRVSHTFWRENGIVKDQTELRSLDGDSPLYAKTKATLVPSIDEPYFDVVTDGTRESLLMVSLKAPVIDKGKFVAVIAFDITLTQFQELVEQIKPFEGSYAYIISNKGLIVGHPDKDLLNKNIVDILPEDSKVYNIARNIEKGEVFSYTSKDENGVKNYVTYAPILVGENNTPWSIALSVPERTIMAEAIRNFRVSLFVGVIGILLMALVIALIGKNITNPITKITDLLNKIAKGHIGEEMKIKIESGDEIEEMAKALNQSVEGLNQKAEFANSIGQGNLDEKFDLLSDEDVLGKSLLDMRANLVKAEEDDNKRKDEDEKRRWANEGLTKFADILRQNNDNLEMLSTEIIMNLVNYLNANQGGVFILNDENKENIHFNLLSAFAYNRRKYMQKHIKIGEGLIGTCAIEKKTVYMTDLPQDYMEITSGLGGASPGSLLIVPLKLEDEVLGVLEIASFNAFDKHEIEFVEKLAESIGSTLSSVRISIRTNELLERSQQQAEEMAAQDEEMRQNMEELQATQEEMRRKEDHLKNVINEMQVQEENLKQTIEKYKTKS